MGLRNWRRSAFAVALVFLLLVATLCQTTLRDSFRKQDGTRPNKQGKYIKCVKDERDGGKKDNCHEVSPPWLQAGGPDDGKYDEKEAADSKGYLDELRRNMSDRPGKGGIYRASLNDFDISEHLLHDLREPTALSMSTVPAPFTKHKPKTYHPYYTVTDTNDWTMRHRANFTECDSPWNGTQSPSDLRTFLGKARSFPEPIFGSAMTMGWEQYTCFERQGRWGPYGLMEDASGIPGYPEVGSINWDEVRWADVQAACYLRNRPRFETHDHGWGERAKPQQALGWLSTWDKAHYYEKAEGTKENTVAKRTAVLVRARYDTKWHSSDMQNMRALIKELALHTGGEYQIFLLVEANEADTSPETWLSQELYQAVIAKSVPPEFATITYLYTESLLRTWYPALPPSDTLRLPFHETFAHLPLQRFAHAHPTFSSFFPLSMNTRFTGHWYSLLSSLGPFARRQPRKLSWEKAERLYIPSLHGAYDNAFREVVERQQVFPGSVVWDHGREVPEFLQHGPRHGREAAIDEHFMWGVGEEADLISLSPIFNPNHTAWAGRGEIWGYKWGSHLRRRAAWGEEMLLSKLLLDIMHHESVEGRFLNAKMTAPTLALLHGLKTVAAPIPIWMENAWTAEEAKTAFLTGPLGQLGTSAKSSYGKNGSADFWWESTYDPESKVAAELWDRWMGRGSLAIDEKERGRMCLPPMLLSPIRREDREEAMPEDLREPIVWAYGG